MRRLVLALTLLVSVTAAQSGAPSSYRVSDITLYGINERHAVFYGEPGSVRQGANTLRLTRGTGGRGLDLPGALRVNGSASLRLPTPKLGAAIVVRNRQGLRLISRVALNAVYYFDGSRWYTLSGVTAGSQNRAVTASPRASLFGAGALDRAEAEALGRYLTRKGGEVIVGVIPTTPSPATLAPAPSAYRRTALVVQMGVRDLPDTSQNPVEPLPPVVGNPGSGSSAGDAPGNTMVTMIGSGSQSQYQEEALGVRLDATPEEFASTWQIVSGFQVPAPSAPFVDFARSKVVTVFLGQKATGGYGMRLLTSNLENGTLRLLIETSEPGAGVITTQALTSPYLMLEVGREVNAVAVELVPVTR